MQACQAPTRNPSPRTHAAQGIAQALFAKFKPPAFSMAIASPKAILWSGAYGRADIELDVPASTNHLFRLASVSKVITAVLAARLVSRGTIDLDKAIANWLPDLPAQHRATTLRQLLTHRGGVRHYKPADYDLSGIGGPIYTRCYKSNQEILDLFINDPLIAPQEAGSAIPPSALPSPRSSWRRRRTGLSWR